MAGAEQRVCSVCDRPVWLSPSLFPDAFKIPILCIPCAVDRMRGEGKTAPDIGRMNDRQVKELRAAGIDIPKEIVEDATNRAFARLIRGGN